MNPEDEVLAGRDGLPFAELRQSHVEVLMVQPLDHMLVDQSVQEAEVDDESGGGIDLPTDGDVQAVVVAVPRQVRTLAEAGAVFSFVPFRTPVQVARAE